MHANLNTVVKIPDPIFLYNYGSAYFCFWEPSSYWPVVHVIPGVNFRCGTRDGIHVWMYTARTTTCTSCPPCLVDSMLGFCAASQFSVKTSFLRRTSSNLSHSTFLNCRTPLTNGAWDREGLIFRVPTKKVMLIF